MRTGFLLLGALLIAASCSKEKRPPQEGDFEKLEFRVDSALLGAEVTVGGLHLFAPKEWLPVDNETLAQIVGVARRDTSAMQLSPEFAFKPEGGGPMLLVSRFPKAVKMGARFVPWAGEVARAYREQRKDIVVQEQWISVGGVEALQLYSQSGQLVHVKIILNADVPVSLDYTVSAADWPKQVRAVESSLGSLRKVYP